MNEKRIEKPVLLAFWVILAAGVWGYNARQIGRVIQPPAAIPPIPDTSSSTHVLVDAAGIEYPAYSGAFRDPFERPARASPRTPPPESPTDTGIALQGIVGQTAIVRMPDGSVLLVTAGETVGSFTVRDVDTDRVRLFDGRRLLTVPLVD
jgi:hypothetical protein